MKYFLAIICLFAVNLATAQFKFPKKEFAEEVKNKTLAVQLLNESDDNNKNLNSAIKDAFAENWTLTKVEFFSPAEFDNILISKDEKYAVLVQQSELHEISKDVHIDPQGRRSRMSMPGSRSEKHTLFTFSHYDFDLLTFQNNKEVIVTTISFANGELSKIDYVFLAQQLSRLVDNAAKETPMKEYYDVDRNISILESYKLILLEDFFKEKEKSMIGKNYNNTFELVNYEKYEDVILNKEANTGYVKILWSNQHKAYVWVVVDSKDGGILSLLSFGGVSFGQHHDANDIIKVKHLKYITAKNGQAFNNKYK